MNSVIVDTNILVYAFDKNSSFYKSSKEILENTNSQLLITTKNISELFSVLSKMKVPYNIIFKHYQQIKQNITLLYPTQESMVIFESLLKKYNPRCNRQNWWLK